MCVPEVLAQGRGVVGEQRVNQTEQLHDSLVLPQVLVALQQEHELVAVAACRGRHKTQRSFHFHEDWVLQMDDSGTRRATASGEILY